MQAMQQDGAIHIRIDPPETARDILTAVGIAASCLAERIHPPLSERAGTTILTVAEAQHHLFIREVNEQTFQCLALDYRNIRVTGRQRSNRRVEVTLNVNLTATRFTEFVGFVTKALKDVQTPMTK
jgi:hypothetical protein